MSFTIREMRQDDLDLIIEIENEAFEIPWGRESYEDEFKNKNARYIVIEEKGEILGYAGMWLIIDEGHITNIAVSKKHRGKKIGEQLLIELERILREINYTSMTLEVREHNLSAIKLYEKFGFEIVGTRTKYYIDEDAFIMWKYFKENEE